MEKYAINKNMLRQLSLMKNHSGPSAEILDSLYAQMVIEVSVYQYQKSSIQKEVDYTLEIGDKAQFEKLTEKYNTFLAKYKDGITCQEQGFEFTIQLEE